MNRRDFHRMMAGVLGAPAVNITSAVSEMKMKTTGQTNLLPLKHLEELLHGYLFDDFLPFMDRYVIDHEQGGFMCTVRPNGERISESKSTWYQGRGLWVYSFLYNNFGRNQAYLDVAARTRKLLEKSRPANTDEMWPKGLHRDGSAASPPDDQIYGDMFIAEGLAEFSKATGERDAWDEAKRIVLNCARIYDRDDYCPQIGETYLGAGARPFPGARIEGVWMVIIRTTTQMLEMHHDDELETLNRRAVDTLLNHHWNPRFNLINELINHDLSRPENEYGELVYAGHAIETLWMVFYEALRRGDESLFDRGAELFQRHCEVARDRVYGGVLRNLKNVDQNDWTLDKTLFPHQEALTGAICLVEHTGDVWAAGFYSELFEYTRTKFSMHSIGSPLWQVMGDRQVTIDPKMTRAENYHQPRFLMLNLLAVQRMIKRSGAPVRQQMK
ncbi:MAG TPA: AGE family epimerase/isomerase [Edaphobacter sp.]|nr:AGE family epimerase/isomerase [Edaphobacter sp.]